MNLAQLRAALKALRTEASQIATRLNDGSATDDDLTRVDTLATEIGDHERQIAELEEQERSTGDREQRARDARERIAALVGSPGTAQRVDTEQRTGTEQRPRLSVGQRFTQSEQLRAFAERNFVGQVAVDFPDVDARALIDNGARPTRDPYVGTINPNPDRALRLADLVDRQTTGLNSVPYIIETGNTGNAAEVAHGAQKNEAGFTFDESEAPVRTIAHWVPITRQAAEDDATLIGYVEGRLAYGLELRLDAQILAGDGTAPNLRGILNTSGVGTYTPGAAEARIVTLRKAITIAQLSEYQPDTAVLHPNDWQEIELDTDDTGSFRVTSNVANALAPRIWGLNVIVTTAITAATYLIGAFKLGATLWERHGVRLLMSDSHGTNFTANILVLLAELRAALTVWRPAAFVKGAFV